jgi:predicted enzyme related to lactoylglutathione lyase
MPTITQHAPGTFCWPELMTIDGPAAKKFYSALFGWDASDVPMGESGPYSLMRVRGQDAGAIFPMDATMRSANIPVHWQAYVSVVSADEAAKKAKALGGVVIQEPFDVFDLGRMAVMQDPTGAVFSVWEPKKHIGVQVMGEPGSLAWTQLNTGDPKKAAAFYTQLLGWKAETMPAPDGSEYTRFMNGETPAGGAMQMPAGAGPSHWLTYFAVTDVDGAAQRTQKEGGKVMVPPADIPNIGRFAVLQDPQGATFAVASFLPPSK